MHFDKQIRKVFYKYTGIVYEYKTLFILIPIILTIALSCGFLLVGVREIVNPFELYAPADGRWQKEIAYVNDHWPMNVDNYYPGLHFNYFGFLDVVAIGLNEHNILNATNLDKLMEINRHIMDNITVECHIHQRQWMLTYRDLCLSYQGACFPNGHLRLVSDWQSDILNKNVTTDLEKFIHDFELSVVDSYKIEYPVAREGSSPILLTDLIGGVDRRPDGTFDYAKAIRLLYNLRQDDAYKICSEEFEEKIYVYLDSIDRTEFDIAINSIKLIAKGLKEVARSFKPFLIITIGVLIVFSVLCSLQWHSDCRLDWIRSKPYLALLGIVTSMMAVLSAFGLLLICGMRFPAIVNVVPFLIISIGVDTMFILDSAWNNEPANISVCDRLKLAMSDACVSITITSLTDFLSFAVGALANLQAVQIFCVYSAVSIAFLYIYYITFYLGLFVIFGKFEQQQRHCLVPCIASKKHCQQIQPIKHLAENDESNERRYRCNRNYDKSRSEIFFSKYYGPFITHWATKSVVLLIYIVYLFVSIYGLFHIREGLDPANLVMDDNSFKKYYGYMVETFYSEGTTVNVLINNAPNMTDTRQLDQVAQVVDDFESYYKCMGPNATIFWYREFEHRIWRDIYDYYNMTSSERYKLMYQYTTFDSENVDQWHLMTQWQSGEEIKKAIDRHPGMLAANVEDDKQYLSAFRFVISIIGYNTTKNNMDVMLDLRAIADHWSMFNVSVYQWVFAYGDQYAMIAPTVTQNILIAFACMTVVSLIFVPSYVGAFIVIVNICSIDIGVVGLMTLWDVNLDAISMITIIMSIGFAVDMTAHITYAFVSAQGSAQTRIVNALHRLGWPVIQGGLSTIFGMITIIGLRTYLITTFVKTIFLVIILGIVHALVFLPVFLIIIIYLTSKLKP